MGLIFKNGIPYLGGKPSTVIKSDTKPENDGNVGDIVYNNNPTPGGYIGWVYTPAGWFGFGMIESVDQIPENAMVMADGSVFRLSDGSVFLYADS